jgi:hypothetical protein
MSTVDADPSVLTLPASEPWPTAEDAIERRCAAVTTLAVDAYGLRELHAGRPFERRSDGFFARLSRAGDSDVRLAPSRAALLGALVEAATLGEKLRPAALALVDERRALDALRSRFSSLATVRVFASTGTLFAPTRERNAALFALIDNLEAAGVRVEFEE